MTRPHHRTGSEDVAAIAEDAERTREELGRTVAALAAKTDVKARAKESMRSKAVTARTTARSGAHQVADQAGRHPAAYGTVALLMGALVRTLMRRRQTRHTMFSRRGRRPMLMNLAESMGLVGRRRRGMTMLDRLMSMFMGRPGRPMGRGMGRSMMGRSMSRGMGRTMGRTMGRGMGRTMGRGMGRRMGRAGAPIGRTMGKTMASSMGHSMGKTMGRTIGKTMGTPTRRQGMMR
ncbi:hypothetical protein Aph01nite_33790 [Acrocarpospora phusangensis]|uniref:DUF3618 domain-containing protein n=1 Tax=Acrocarpospora phusangensis TaxID=1070424 RepID=A0A919UKI7_9ACTN|nr:DUF3618 domain-containing protein [Acrocarpospora phusangensis]GIH25069.1 hypothetical protein Aph01nite_33790 [Acrocarpospora phusangensis]